MARTIVVLTPSLWTVLGTGKLTVTIHVGGSNNLFLNSAQTDNTSLIVSRFRQGDQFFNTNVGDTISAKANGPGWVVAVDPF